ncbi:hypothetical protein DYB30_002986 [Aphanomyces astaci]|uniref:Uncharacterized protein n=1 Tax=Aphanomyces astaci TaxID=112090 RepID=A0A397CV29_APHAT|nr:hypothetical protein DYB30_002986 [Aphanomyces astaci]
MRQARNHSPRCAPLNPSLSNPPLSNPPLSNPPLSNPPLSNPPLPNPPLPNPPLPNPPQSNPPMPNPPQLNPPMPNPPLSNSHLPNPPLLLLNQRSHNFRGTLTALKVYAQSKQTLSLDELADPVVIKRIHEIRNRLASSVCRRVSDASWYDNNSFVLKHLSELPGGMREAVSSLFVARAAIHPYDFLPEALWGCSADIMGLTRALDRDIFVFAERDHGASFVKYTFDGQDLRRILLPTDQWEVEFKVSGSSACCIYLQAFMLLQW